MDSYVLNEADRKTFAEMGFTQPFRHPLLTGTDYADRIIAAHQTYEHRLAYPGPTNVDMERKLDSGMLWFQSTFTLIPELYDVVSHPALVDRVTSVLGPDVMVWACTVLRKRPTDVHVWHTDLTKWEGVTAFVGLRGMNRSSNVKVMTRTHRLTETPFDIFTTGQFTDALHESPMTDDDLVLRAARSREPRAEIVAHDMGDGEFFLFDALAWHGSRNTSQDTRCALAIFYARPDADVQIPTAFGKTPVWYREKPSSILVAGIDRFKKNRLIAPPTRGG